MVNLTVDGKNISAPKGTMLLEAIRGAGISIPTLCAHEAVSRSGACRLCVVEIKKGNRTRIVTSCLYAAEEGLDCEYQKRPCAERAASGNGTAFGALSRIRSSAETGQRTLRGAAGTVYSLIRIKASAFYAVPACAFAKKLSA